MEHLFGSTHGDPWFLSEWFKSPSHAMVFRWDPGYLMPPPWLFVNLTSLLVGSRCMTAEQGSIGYNLAAWSCVNATAGQVISAAPLHKLSQTNDRAELTAALSALQWQHKFQVDMDIWIDALHVVQGLDLVLLHGVAGHWMNQDIWIEIVDILAGLHGLQTRPHWIPSHLDSNALTCPFEDWIKKWNDHADTLAGQVNANRPEVLLYWSCAVKHSHIIGRWLLESSSYELFSFKWLRNPNLPCWLLFPFMILMKRSHSRSLLCTCQGFLSCFRLHQVNPRSAMNSFPLCSVAQSSFWWGYPRLWFECWRVCFAVGFRKRFSCLGCLKSMFWTFSRWQSFRANHFGISCELWEEGFFCCFRFGDDFSEVLIDGHAKVHLGVHWQTCGIFVRLHPSCIERGCSALQRFTTARALRRSCDWARPAWPQTWCDGTALLCLCTVGSFELYILLVQFRSQSNLVSSRILESLGLECQYVRIYNQE